MLHILCNNCSLFVPREQTPELAWHPFKHSLGQVSLPKKKDHFVHNDKYRKTRFLSLIFTIQGSHFLAQGVWSR